MPYNIKCLVCYDSGFSYNDNFVCHCPAGKKAANQTAYTTSTIKLLNKQDSRELLKQSGSYEESPLLQSNLEKIRAAKG